MSGQDHRAAYRCERCGQRCAAKRLTVINGGEAICKKCLDHIPWGQRRTLLRNAAKGASR